MIEGSGSLGAAHLLPEAATGEAVAQPDPEDGQPGEAEKDCGTRPFVASESPFVCLFVAGAAVVTCLARSLK